MCVCVRARVCIFNLHSCMCARVCVHVFVYSLSKLIMRWLSDRSGRPVKQTIGTRLQNAETATEYT